MKLAPLKLSYATADGFVDFEIPIKISVDYKFFYVIEALPEALRKLEACPPGPRQYFDTFYELSQSVSKLIEEIELALVEETKTTVILYEIDHETSNTNFQRIGLRFEVLQKVEQQRVDRDRKSYTEVKYYRAREVRGHSMGYVLDEYEAHQFRQPSEMAWTSEREAWFVAMEKSLQGMGEKLVAGFGTRPHVLAMRIGRGSKFLLGGSDEPT